MANQSCPCPTNDYLSDYISLITNSLRKLANVEIVDFSLGKTEQARQVFNSEYFLLAHNATSDPIFNYANKSILELFEMSWEEFTNMPSKYSAEADERADRERFLSEVAHNGFSDNYSGIRISKTGKRFKISNVLLWNVYDLAGNRIGQAAKFDSFEYV